MAVVSQQDLVKKIYFPREVLPISFVTSCFVNMLLSFVVVFGVLAVSGIGFNLKALVFLPVVMLVEYMLALGITMITSACNVYFRDLEHIIGVFMMAWIYLTPVMYDISYIPDNLRPVFYFNPMTSVALAYRDILYYKQVPEISTLGMAVVIGMAALIIGSFVFNKLQRNFIEEL